VTVVVERAIQDDTLDEGRRLVAALEAEGLRARLLGGAGVALHGHGPLPPALGRTYGDLDFVVRRRDSAGFRHVLEASGYQPNQRFNAVHGHRRLLYYDDPRDRQIDAFIGDFAMCHALDLDARLPGTGESIAPADLLLTKLQVVEINDKDLLDVVALLIDHPVADRGDEAIERGRVGAVLGRDWGWHTTVTDNLVHLAERLERVADLDGVVRDRVRGSIDELGAIARTAPKSLRWRTRARVGRRVPWYELPEEVAR
jgi:putative nucleotidyltransferase-like protein